MGYTTDFTGSFSVSPALKPEHSAYLTAFADSRRMGRKLALVANKPDPIREAAGLPLGDEGGYYLGDTNPQIWDDPTVIDHNTPPAGQPGLWCQWVPTEDGEQIEWDGGEKFYDYENWIEYLIEHFLKPWGYVVSGEVQWFGESRDDIGQIKIENNVVEVQYGRIVYGEAE